MIIDFVFSILLIVFLYIVNSVTKSLAILIYFINNSLVLVFLFDMANTISHSNNSSANCRRIVCVFDHFMGLAFNDLRVASKIAC